jgi:hypothetical protein
MSKKTFIVLNLSMCLLLGGCSTETLKEHDVACEVDRKDNSEFFDYRSCLVYDADLDGVSDDDDLCPNSPSSVCSGSGLNEIDEIEIERE